jgi:dTDP-4-amino-4,6-dideoxygalactose transaminase
MTKPPLIPFNRPVLLGRETDYVREALASSHLSGNGPFTVRASAALENLLGGGKALLTTSCTTALEMAAILAGLEPGDEVIMPSFTFASTANAVVLRGAKPVFVDIRPDTLNIDEAQIETAITPRTKAICVVHYAGVGCEMAPIGEIADRHGLMLIEDAAQALCASWCDQPLARFGALAALSFHETKNLMSGEGGALIVNREDLVERAEIVWEKGTNRVKFSRGEIDKYTWIDVGGSFLPSEITAAILLGQIEEAYAATAARLSVWRRYQDAFEPLEAEGRCLRPRPPPQSNHNGHIYYLLAPTDEERIRWLEGFRAANINAISHYVPLHSAPAGRKFGRAAGPMDVTDDIASRLVRLPMHLRLSEQDQMRVIGETRRILREP